MNSIEKLYLETLKLELEYLKNPTSEVAKKYLLLKNKLCKNKKFKKVLFDTNITILSKGE